MSYRTYVNGVQLFGNNESYGKWYDFLIAQGIVIDEYGLYDGKITDFMGAVRVLEEIVLDMEKERREAIQRFENSIPNYQKRGFTKEDIDMFRKSRGAVSCFDFRYMYDEIVSNDSSTSLFDELFTVVNNGYMLLPYTFYMACKDDLEHSEDRENLRVQYFHNYKLKDGKTIKVCAR